MPSKNDPLKTSPEEVGGGDRKPPELKGDKAVPAYWGRKLGLPFNGAMRVAKIPLDAEITKDEFTEALQAHGILPSTKDGKKVPPRVMGYGKRVVEEVT